MVDITNEPAGGLVFPLGKYRLSRRGGRAAGGPEGVKPSGCRSLGSLFMGQKYPMQPLAVNLGLLRGAGRSKVWGTRPGEGANDEPMAAPP